MLHFYYFSQKANREPEISQEDPDLSESRSQNESQKKDLA